MIERAPQTFTCPRLGQSHYPRILHQHPVSGEHACYIEKLPYRGVAGSGQVQVTRGHPKWVHIRARINKRTQERIRGLHRGWPGDSRHPASRDQTARASQRIQPRGTASISVVRNRAKQGLPSSRETMTLFWNGSLQHRRTWTCHSMKSLNS
jgi:hypothetical protein